MVSKDKSRVLITIPSELLEEIKKLAEKDNRSVSNYIVSVLLYEVENSKMTN